MGTRIFHGREKLAKIRERNSRKEPRIFVETRENVNFRDCENSRFLSRKFAEFSQKLRRFAESPRFALAEKSSDFSARNHENSLLRIFTCEIREIANFVLKVHKSVRTL